MKFVQSLLIVISTILITSCLHTVNVTVNNTAKYEQDATLIINDQDGKSTEYQLGIIKKDEKQTKQFKVDNGSTFHISSSLINSATVFSETKTVSKTDPDPLDMKFNITFQEGGLFDPELAKKKISTLFSDFGVDIGFKPVSLRDGLPTWIGAIVLVIPPKNQNSRGEVKRIIYPNKISQPEDYNSFHYPMSLQHNSDEVNMSGDYGANLTIPVIGGLGTSLANSDISIANWQLDGFGWCPKFESSDWDLATALDKLPNITKELLYNQLKEHPDAKLMYINDFYVIKKGYFKVYKAKKLDSKVKADAYSIITVNGAYSKSQEILNEQNYEEEILNINGFEISLKFTPIIKDNIKPNDESLDQKAFRIEMEKIQEKQSEVYKSKKIKTIPVFDLKISTEIIKSNTLQSTGNLKNIKYDFK